LMDADGCGNEGKKAPAGPHLELASQPPRQNPALSAPTGTGKAFLRNRTNTNPPPLPNQTTCFNNTTPARAIPRVFNQ
jgi:hypothetical protein